MIPAPSVPNYAYKYKYRILWGENASLLNIKVLFSHSPLLRKISEREFLFVNLPIQHDCFTLQCKFIKELVRIMALQETNETVFGFEVCVQLKESLSN